MQTPKRIQPLAGLLSAVLGLHAASCIGPGLEPPDRRAPGSDSSAPLAPTPTTTPTGMEANAAGSGAAANPDGFKPRTPGAGGAAAAAGGAAPVAPLPPNGQTPPPGAMAADAGAADREEDAGTDDIEKGP